MTAAHPAPRPRPCSPGLPSIGPSIGPSLRPSPGPAIAWAFGLGVGLLTMAGCPAQTQSDTAPKAGDAKASAQQDAIDAERTRTEVARAEAAKKTAAVPIKDAPPTDADAAPKKYRVGMVPPEGMSLEEIEKFAADVGDPTGGKFTLEQAFEGDPTLADKSKGTLTASFDTTMGAFDCELYEEQAPLTVANFVGLARGTRPTYDKKQRAWVTKKYYDGNIFHRVIKNFMIQTGDDTNTGRGNPGYVIPDELQTKLAHGSAGVLSMANRSKPNTGNTQFFITVRATKHLDGKHAVFGKCADAKVPIEISKVKVDHRAGDRPYEQVKINSVTISRK